MQQSGELNVIKQYIKDNDIVFDVGANVGEWSSCVLNNKSNINLHIFEPIKFLCNELKVLPKNTSTIKINNIAISNSCSLDKTFYFYSENLGLSTLHRRLIAEPLYNIKPPIETSVKTTTIDSYCLSNNIQNINFLKIDSEGSEFDILTGSQLMIENDKIKHIQFEYGGCYLDSKTTLKQVYSFMNLYNYDLYKINQSDLTPIKQFNKNLEDYQYSNFLLINHPY